MKLILLCVWAERAILDSAKTALIFKHEICLKSERKNHDLHQDLTFYCTHNQLCVPQDKVNV
jgi:hypothetical protein